MIRPVQLPVQLKNRVVLGGEPLDVRSLELHQCQWGVSVPPELHHQHLGDRFGELYLKSEGEKDLGGIAPKSLPRWLRPSLIYRL